MTADDTPLSPAQEAVVRARLAEARHTDPVPDRVVARLDTVLADLTAERAAGHHADDDAPAGPMGPPLAPVVPLGTRRRRAVATGLVAAAAVVALGVALPEVLETGTSGGSDSASTADRGAGGATAEGQGSDDAGAATESSPSELADGQAAESGRAGSTFAAPLVLTSDRPLRPAVRALVRGGAVAAYDAQPGCVLDVGAGDRVDATWDGSPAVVVLRPVEASRRGVEVYVCGSDEVVASTTLRAP